MKKAFTLLEMVITAVILGLIFTVVTTAYKHLMESKLDIFVRSSLAKQTNNLVEKLNILMKNYNIDYEEYFNRKMVGCNSQNGGDNFTWDVGIKGYCKNFTTYGNSNSIPDSNSGTGHVFYFCSSVASDGQLKEKIGGNKDCEGNSDTGSAYIYAEKTVNDLQNGKGCRASEAGGNTNISKIQSFGEYKYQFWDMKKNADGINGCYLDDDDLDLGIGPIAIGQNTGVKELYLISKDGKKRFFLRRKLISSGDFIDNNGVNGNLTGERLYKFQILKLRGFDLGSKHNGEGNTAYDGQIDTWACDKLEGFKCNGLSLSPTGYTGYNLPKNIEDGWIDINTNDITIENFNLTIFPSKYYSYDWYETGSQIYPYVTLYIKTAFYGQNYSGKINPKKLVKYKMNIQTTFSIKPY